MAPSRKPSLANLVNRLTALHACGRQEIMSGFLEVLGQAVSADAFMVLRIDPGPGTAAVLGGAGLKTPRKSWGDGLEAPHIAKQVANFPDKPAIAAVGSFACDPLLSREKARVVLLSCIGLVDHHLATIAIRRSERQFTAHEIDRFAAVSGVVNLLGRCCHLEQEVERAGGKDPHTGLGRFQEFHRGLVMELSRARRGSGCVTVGLISLEREEKQGPPDIEMMMVADVMGSQLRNFDTLVRYSPSELAFILPDLKGAEGVKVMQRVQGEIVKALEECHGPAWTCIGLAGYPDDASSVERLIEMAEAACNQVREGGKTGVARWQG